ncbi:hypothetical protein ACHAW5_007852 [Stephanodiscus triporus]|uniref:Uncharacterized protein n=1 Tax=Stephanodiscus triporus TaxID=2934178 RepID=A0ABD3Q7V8_9STRA
MKIKFSHFTAHTSIALLNFSKGNAHDDENVSLRGWKNSKVGRSLSVQGSEVVYTTNSDFDFGSSVNVNHNDIQDQLQLDSSSNPFNFIWVACSTRGTVIKVDTLSGTILGEYRSSPRYHPPSTQVLNGNPSRTTMDPNGSVWVANRNAIGPNNRGTIVHISLNENNQCEDCNGIPGIQTSTGLGDIKNWTNMTGNRGVSTADDECIVHYTEVNSTGTCHLSIDSNYDVWVSGSGIQTFDKVKGGRWDVQDSGKILVSYPSVGKGGYGGLIDPNGFLWSSHPDAYAPYDIHLLRWDTSKPLNGTNGDPLGNSIGPLLPGTNWASQNIDSYGLCIDSQGNVWSTTMESDGIVKFASNGTHGNHEAQGCAVGLNDDVWVAHGKAITTSSPSYTVGHLLNNGTHLGNVRVGRGPTGVAVDGKGKVWSTNYDNSSLLRIDPSLNNGVGGVDLNVSLGSGCGPYNYGSMTGRDIPPPQFRIMDCNL